MVSKYRNAGQTCVCANRLYVRDGVYEASASPRRWSTAWSASTPA